MKAVILAAGEGSRMRPLTYTRPKVMLPLANKPILEHLLVNTIQAGITDFIFVVGYHDEQVRDYFGDGSKWKVNVEYCSQRKQLGTADAIKMAEGSVIGNFLVMNGDMIVNYKDIVLLASKTGTTMSIFNVENARSLGTVELSKDKVLHIYEKLEKPHSNIANAGLYLLTPEIFDAISGTPKSPRGEYEITDSLQLIIDGGHPVSYHQLSYWIDLSYPWDLLTANELLISGIEPQNLGRVEENVAIRGNVIIGENTLIRSGSYIIGPVVVGQNCDIGPNCYIRPYTSISNNCHIGAAVEIKNSIIMRGSKIPHQNYVGDSIIGESCNLGSGTKIANLRLDKKEIAVGTVNTKRRKLGAIIGDKVETGINAAINVGSAIGNDTHIGPGALVSGVVSPYSKIL